MKRNNRLHAVTAKCCRVLACGLLALTLGLPTAQAKKEKYNWQTDLQHRLHYDFNATRDDVVDYIRRYVPRVNDAQIEAWEQSRALEQMTLDGEKWYFKRAARNLFRIDPKCREIWDKAYPDDALPSEKEIVCLRNIPQILRDAPNDANHTAQSRHMRVTYTLTVEADAVPDGTTLRCWLPFPRRDEARQPEVTLLSTSEDKFILSKPDAPHSTLYMEKQARAGQPTEFTETFEYTCRGSWFDLSQAQPYDTGSRLYKTYTSERDCHIRFTPELRALADSLAGNIADPVEKARRYFCYIDENFPWASAREYSTIENIPMYVWQNRHGDCGMKSLLFITLCRMSGIPARFESGFMMHPGAWNMHDWAEVWFEGLGWVPVDQSFGVQQGSTDRERMFYLGGIDSWRMIVNSDYGMPLQPKKKYPRSETVDFQRGEVEWARGNVYYDQWTWDMDIEYID